MSRKVDYAYLGGQVFKSLIYSNYFLGGQIFHLFEYSQYIMDKKGPKGFLGGQGRRQGDRHERVWGALGGY